MPPLVSEGGGLVCESVGKADLLSDHFDSKQSRETVDLPLTCHPSPSLTTFAFRSSEVRHLLLNLDPYGGDDPLGMCPLFLKNTGNRGHIPSGIRFAVQCRIYPGVTFGLLTILLRF